ncbi:hypothetical protein V1499_23125 (plasmid) [Neobacillus sp. SCS-31]|uniref:hypothetical protein n=1 Tax=Neobacillus oceani TaxID=3115292 RepID=UPI003905848C
MTTYYPQPTTMLNKNNQKANPTNMFLPANAPKPQVTNYGTPTASPAQPATVQRTTGKAPSTSAAVGIANNAYSVYKNAVANNPATNSATANQPAAIPTPPKPEPFSFSYNYMDYDTARSQAEQQFNPLYEQAVKNIQAQQYQNEVASGEAAANRGIAQSGLAADSLNKIKIASQGQIADANAQKMSQVAAVAQMLMQQDKMRGDELYRQAYQQYRDSIGDTRYLDETTYNRNIDTRNFDYQKSLDSWNQNYMTGRATRSDFESDRNYDRGVFESDRGYNRGVFESNRAFDYQKATDTWEQNFKTKLEDNRRKEWEIETKNDQYWKTVDKNWREHVFNNLSADQLANYKMLKEQFGEDIAFRYAMKEAELKAQKGTSQAEIDFYKSGFPAP